MASPFPYFYTVQNTSIELQRKKTSADTTLLGNVHGDVTPAGTLLVVRSPSQPKEVDRFDPDSGAFVPLQAMIEEAERVHIQHALGRASGSVSKTADLLGISRKTLWEKMKRLSISGNVRDSSGASVEG